MWLLISVKHFLTEEGAILFQNVFYNINMNKKFPQWRKNSDKLQKKDSSNPDNGYVNSSCPCLDALERILIEEPRYIKKVHAFLKNIIGSESVQEVEFLDEESQRLQTLEHLRIGLSVGDVTEDDVWKLAQS